MVAMITGFMQRQPATVITYVYRMTLINASFVNSGIEN
jgi:hypothetical protein